MKYIYNSCLTGNQVDFKIKTMKSINGGNVISEGKVALKGVEEVGAGQPMDCLDVWGGGRGLGWSVTQIVMAEVGAALVGAFRGGGGRWLCSGSIPLGL